MKRTTVTSSLRAVVTADVVDSTERLSSAQRAAFADGLREAYGRLQRATGRALPHALAVYGGDSWQGYAHDPDEGLRLGLTLRAWARATYDVDTRFALAVDTVDFVDEANVGESDGPAFRTSGRRAADLDGDERLAISLVLSLDADSFPHVQQTYDDLLGTAGDVVARLADHIARGWTAAQAQAAMWRLLDPSLTNEEIGKRWTPEPVSHQSISKHLQRGGWPDLRGALRHYKRTVEAAATLYAWAERLDL